MSRLVIDASVAIKWVVAEDGTPEAVSLLGVPGLVAPDLLIPECSNILWTKVRRSELTADEAMMAARILQHADVEIYPMRSLLETATRLALDLDRAAYDCVYLALAVANGWRFVTADVRFLRRVRQATDPMLGAAIASLREVAASLG
ncbi:MAG: PilT protein N-terminal, partial [Rhizorhabdus sp.]|nr:PilT protein N-terminal [Rhizorhabdus sp.]